MSCPRREFVALDEGNARWNFSDGTGACGEFSSVWLCDGMCSESSKFLVEVVVYHRLKQASSKMKWRKFASN